MTVIDGYRSAGKQLNALSSVLISDRLPDWLIDDLPESPKTILAKTLRRGVFLSAFTVFEDFIRSASQICIEEVNALALPINPTSTAPLDDARKIFNRISKAVENIPPWISSDVRTFYLDQYATSISTAVRHQKLMIPEYAYFARSNVSYESLRQFMRDIEIFRDLRFASSQNALNTHLVTGVNYLNLQVISSDLVLDPSSKDHFKDCFQGLLESRNKYAHGYENSPSIADLRQSLKIFDVLLLAVASYLLWYESAFNTGDPSAREIQPHYNPDTTIVIDMLKRST